MTNENGALGRVVLGDQVKEYVIEAIRAEGTTPMRLAIALARAMVKTPAMAAQAVRSLLPGRKG